MTISRAEIDQMANFMRALNTQGMSAPADHTPDTLNEHHAPVAQRRPVTNGDGVQEMKDVLTRFYAATDGAMSRINEDARSDSQLRESLVTERTSRGSRIGDWEIQVRQEGKRKFYDVVQNDGGACIASDLLLYEAAHGLVRILNGGGKLNSLPAINLLRAEQDYASALNDAVIYKHYLTKHPKDARTYVFEARYSEAKERAIAARDQVMMISEKR